MATSGADAHFPRVVAACFALQLLIIGRFQRQWRISLSPAHPRTRGQADATINNISPANFRLAQRPMRIVIISFTLRVNEMLMMLSCCRLQFLLKYGDNEITAMSWREDGLKISFHLMDFDENIDASQAVRAAEALFGDIIY